MAVSLLAHEVSDLCLGKPALRSLPVSSTTVADALSALKRSGEAYLSVWTCNHQETSYPEKADNVEECRCIGKVCLADIVSFLAKEDKLKDPARALQEPVSVLLLSKVPGIVRHLGPHASLLEAIDLILEGAQNLVIPIHSPFTRKRVINKPPTNSTVHKNREYCWLTHEDVLRYLLNSIGLFSPISNHSIESLGIVDSESMLAVYYNDPASSALPLISQSLIKQTSVAILDIDDKLIGEISPFTLGTCDETLAAAIATLSIGDLMAYIDCGEPPEDIVRMVKEKLEERNLDAALEVMEDESAILSSASSTCSSYSSSDDDEYGSGRSGRFSRSELELGRSGRFSRSSTRAARSTEAIMCYPWNSLIAVMIQAISHRLSYVWVVEEDGSLVGVVTFTGMLKVFRERLKSMI